MGPTPALAPRVVHALLTFLVIARLADDEADVIQGATVPVEGS